MTGLTLVTRGMVGEAGAGWIDAFSYVDGVEIYVTVGDLEVVADGDDIEVSVQIER